MELNTTNDTDRTGFFVENKHHRIWIPTGYGTQNWEQIRIWEKGEHILDQSREIYNLKNVELRLAEEARDRLMEEIDLYIEAEDPDPDNQKMNWMFDRMDTLAEMMEAEK